MNKCSPVEMRKALIMVETFKSAGIDFVAVPVLNEKHKLQLLREITTILDKLEKESNNEQRI